MANGLTEEQMLAVVMADKKERHIIDGATYLRNRLENTALWNEGVITSDEAAHIEAVLKRAIAGELTVGELRHNADNLGRYGELEGFKPEEEYGQEYAGLPNEHDDSITSDKGERQNGIRFEMIQEVRDLLSENADDTIVNLEMLGQRVPPDYAEKIVSPGVAHLQLLLRDIAMADGRVVEKEEALIKKLVEASETGHLIVAELLDRASELTNPNIPAGYDRNIKDQEAALEVLEEQIHSTAVSEGKYVSLGSLGELALAPPVVANEGEATVGRKQQ